MSNLLSELGHDVTGIDASEGMLKKAQSNSEALHNPMHLIQGDGEVLPFDDSSFDAVVNRYVLWTLPSRKRQLLNGEGFCGRSRRLVIVDGTWFDERDKTACRQLWRSLSMILITC